MAGAPGSVLIASDRVATHCPVPASLTARIAAPPFGGQRFLLLRTAPAPAPFCSSCEASDRNPGAPPEPGGRRGEVHSPDDDVAAAPRTASPGAADATDRWGRSRFSRLHRERGPILCWHAPDRERRAAREPCSCRASPDAAPGSFSAATSESSAASMNRSAASRDTVRPPPWRESPSDSLRRPAASPGGFRRLPLVELPVSRQFRRLDQLARALLSAPPRVPACGFLATGGAACSSRFVIPRGRRYALIT